MLKTEIKGKLVLQVTRGTQNTIILKPSSWHGYSICGWMNSRLYVNRALVCGSGDYTQRPPRSLFYYMG